MKSAVEKLAPGKIHRQGRGWRRWYKRLSAKLMRRLGRRLQEEAPGRLPTRGWTD